MSVTLECLNRLQCTTLSRIQLPHVTCVWDELQRLSHSLSVSWTRRCRADTLKYDRRLTHGATTSSRVD